MTPARIMRFASALLAVSALSWNVGVFAAVVQEVRVSFNPATITVDDTTNLVIDVKTSQGRDTDTGMNIEVPLQGLFSVGAMAFQDCFGATSVSTGTSVNITGLKSRPGKICSMSIKIGASSPGTYRFTQGWIVVTSDGRTSGNSDPVTLQVLPARPAILSASQASVAFGAQRVGVSSGAQSLALRNTGTGSLAINGIATSGDFSVSGCAVTSIAADGECTLSIVFRPTATGVRDGSIQVSTNAAGSPLVILLSGTGVAPEVSLAPSPLAFGNVLKGTTASAGVALTNTGGAPLAIAAIAVSGTHFGATSACPASLAAGAACQVTVTYSPASTGLHAGQLAVQSDAASGVNAVALSGTGTAPAVTLNPASVSFGSIPVQSTATSVVTLTNSGSAPLAIASIAASGTGFTQTGNCPGSLAPSASCQITVAYSPPNAASNTGSLSVQSNAVGSPHAVPLFAGAATMPAAALSPASLAFTDVVVSTSASSTIRLSNPGSAPLAISAIAVTGAFFAQANDCPGSLASGASCAIGISYAPTSTGSHTGQLSVTSNASASPTLAALSGAAVPAPAAVLSLSSASLAFGSRSVGSESAPQTVVLTNTGNATLTLNSVTTSGDYLRDGCPAGTSLAAGAACSMAIVFKPVSGGSRPGTVQIASNDAGGLHSIALSGIGATSPGIALSATALDFGTAPSGSTVLLRVVVKSTGTEALALSSIGVAGAAFTQTHLCPASLAPGGSCDIWVAFAPQSEGSHTGTLSVQTNAAGGPSLVVLTGNATPAPAPVMGLSRTAIAFGAQTVGLASNVQSVVVSNPGTTALDLLSITAGGDYGFEGCATPLSLVAGASCELSIRFLPTAVGARAGSLTITSNASGSPHTIALTGEGTPAPVPGIVVAPTSADFGAIAAGASIVTHLALTNTGGAALAITGISTTAAVFSHASTCPASLAPKAACQISVTYAPASAGSHTGELHVVSNAVPSPLVVPLSGSALPVSTPLLHLSSTSVVFGPQFVNVASSPKTVTLANGGLAPLQISGITSTGDFGYGGCGYPATLLPGQSCTFSIIFKPLSVGVLSGAIEIASNAPGGPHTITLSGKGASFAVPEISLSPSHLAFGPQPIGAVATQRMGLRNAGASVLEISSIRASGPHFSQRNDCPAVLAVGAGCEIVVTYAPTAIGAHGGHIVIESNAIPSPHAAPLSGSGIAVPPPFLAVDRLVDFGQQVVGTTARESLRLANTGGHHLAIAAARILGGTEFGIGTGCASIAPAASCVLELTFTPTAVREFAARLDIVSNHSGGVVQVDLAGAGVPKALPDLELSVAGLGWGNQTVGTLGEERIVKLTSIGGEALRINAITAGPDFVVNAGQCPALLDPKRSCEVRVAFRPLVPGPRQGRLTIDSNASGEPDSVSLTGVGCRLFAMGAARNPSRLCAP